jgi:hypothetical protein
MLTAKQKAAASLIAQAGAAATPQARAKNIAKVIEALGLHGKEMFQKAGELRKKAGNTEPFEILAALCHERLRMYLTAGEAYLRLGMRSETERIIALQSGSIFNIDRYQAAMLAAQLSDCGRAAAIAAQIEGTSLDFVTMDRARQNEGVPVQNNLVLAGRVYAELHARCGGSGGWKDRALRIAVILHGSSRFEDAALLHYSLGDEPSARGAAELISYDPERLYCDDIFQMLIKIGMKSKAEEIAEAICKKPSKANRTIRAAEIFTMTGNNEKASRIYLDCERHLDALAALEMEK